MLSSSRSQHNPIEYPSVKQALDEETARTDHRLQEERQARLGLANMAESYGRESDASLIQPSIRAGRPISAVHRCNGTGEISAASSNASVRCRRSGNSPGLTRRGE